MSKTRQNAIADDDDDAFDERGILRDGKRWRVPMFMMDSMQRDVAQHFARVVDADGAPLGQPGFTRATAATDKNKLYDEYDASVAAQYQNNTGVGSHGFVGCQVGDLCTVRAGAGALGAEGSAGHLRSIDGALVCVADGFNPQASTDHATADQIKDVAYQYQAYDAEISQAYRRHPR